jgi:hypothetical protein
MKTVISALLSTSVLLSAASAAHAEITAAGLLDRSAHLLNVGNWRQAASASRALLARSDLTMQMRLAGNTNLCVAETKLDHLSAAETACDKSVALNPGYWVNYVNRGNVRRMIGDVRGAHSDYARAKALNPTLQHHPLMGTFTADFVAFGVSTPSTQQAAAP